MVRIYGIILLLILFCITGLNGQSTGVQDALQQYKAGNYLGAGEKFEQLLAAGNAARELYLAAIDCFIKTHTYTKAIKYLEQMHARFGADYDSRLALAQLYLETGSYIAAARLYDNLIKERPGKDSVNAQAAIANYNAGLQFCQKSEYAVALPYLQKSVAYSRANRDAQRTLAFVYARLKRFSEALPLLEGLYKVESKNIATRDLYVEVLVGLGKYEKALNLLNAAASQNPNDLELQLKVVLLMRYNGQPEEALARYRDLRTLYPKEKSIYRQAAELIGLAFPADSLISLYQDYLKVYPGDPEFMRLLGKAFEFLKNFTAAKSVYAEMRDIGRDSSARLYLADVYLLENMRDSAIQQLTEYVALTPKQPEPFLLLSSLLTASGDVNAAKHYLQEGRGVFSGELSLTAALATLHYYLAEYDSCMAVLLPVAIRQAENPVIPFLLGTLYEMRDSTNLAANNFRRAAASIIKRMQTLQEQLSNTLQGQNLFSTDSVYGAKERGSEFDSLTAMLKTTFSKLRMLLSGTAYGEVLDGLIRNAPSAAVLLLRRAEYYANNGQPNLAEADYKRALLLAPADESVLRETGLFYEAQGNAREAFSYFYKAVGTNPTEPLYYQKCIELGRSLQLLGQLCDYWKQLYITNSGNTVLRDALIHALENAGRFSEAAEIAEGKQ